MDGKRKSSSGRPGPEGNSSTGRPLFSCTQVIRSGVVLPLFIVSPFFPDVEEVPGRVKASLCSDACMTERRLWERSPGRLGNSPCQRIWTCGGLRHTDQSVSERQLSVFLGLLSRGWDPGHCPLGSRKAPHHSAVFRACYHISLEGPDVSEADFQSDDIWETKAEVKGWDFINLYQRRLRELNISLLMFRRNWLVTLNLRFSERNAESLGDGECGPRILILNTSLGVTQDNYSLKGQLFPRELMSCTSRFLRARMNKQHCASLGSCLELRLTAAQCLVCGLLGC